jgi:hypothetical protein
MKKIKLSIVGLLLSGLSYGQDLSKCCVKTIHEVYEHEGMVMSEFRKDSVQMSYTQLLTLFNDLDEMLSWFKEDENNGDFSHGSIDEEWGHVWLVNMWADKIEEILSEHGHRVHLNK